MTREDRAYNFLVDAKNSALARHRTGRMVAQSKKANKSFKRGDFHKAKLAERKSQAWKNKAEHSARYNQNKLIDIQHKDNDGHAIRHENKVRSISKLE